MFKRIKCAACDLEFRVDGKSGNFRKYCDECKKIGKRPQNFNGLTVRAIVTGKEEIPVIAHLLVDSPELAGNFQAIGEITGIPTTRVKSYFITNELLQNIRLSGSKKLTMMIPKALKVIDELMTQTDNMDARMKSASKVLDTEHITRNASNESIDVNVTIENKTTEELRDIVKKAARIPAPTIEEGEIIG